MRIALAALLALPLLALAGYPADQGVERGPDGKLPRSRAALAEFKRAHPCPATGKPKGACPGWQVDHIRPLKRGGADAPENMQWLTTEAHRRKSAYE